MLSFFDNLLERWQKHVEKDDNKQFQQKEEIIQKPEPQEDSFKLCDDAVDSFLKGNFSFWQKTLDKLNIHKNKSIREMLTEQDLLIQKAMNPDQDFNEKFRNELSGHFLQDPEDQEDQDSEEEKQQAVLNKVFKSQLSSGNMDKEMHMDMLLQKRNLMMRLRQEDNEFKKFDFKNEGFDGQLLEKKMRKGESERYEKREEKRQNQQAKKNQRMLQKCNQCYYLDRKFDQDLVIADSENCYVSFPIKTAPLIPEGNEPISHVIIAPKQHYVNYIEVDEQVQDETKNFQQSIIQYYQKELNMQTIFIETSIQSEHNIPHAQIDCIGVPNDIENEFDMELFFRKSFLEDDSEWGSHKKIIDTKEKKGMIWKCIPGSGVFNYVHIDFNGLGGFAHIIEEAKKYSETKALEVLGGAIGHELVNLKIPMRQEKAVKVTRDIRRKFSKYDWTRQNK